MGTPAPAQETLSRQSCIQIPDDYLSRILQEMAQVHPVQYSSMFHFDYIYNVTVSPASSLCVEMCNANVGMLSSPSPAQPCTAQHSSAQISRAKFLGMEFINQLGLSPLQPELATSHRAQPGVDYTEKLFDNIHLFNLSSNLDNVNVDDVVEF